MIGSLTYYFDLFALKWTSSPIINPSKFFIRLYQPLWMSRPHSMPQEVFIRDFLQPSSLLWEWRSNKCYLKTSKWDLEVVLKKFFINSHPLQRVSIDNECLLKTSKWALENVQKKIFINSQPLQRVSRDNKCLNKTSK